MFVSLSVAEMRTTVHKNAIFSKTKQFRAIVVAIDDMGSPTLDFRRTHYILDP